MGFIKNQFIDMIEWMEPGDGTLAWRFPMQDREVQNGGSLTVGESQLAVFVNEGKVADVFGPGRHTLSTATLPVLIYLKNWNKLFESPFKRDLYFVSTRQCDVACCGALEKTDGLACVARRKPQQCPWLCEHLQCSHGGKDTG